MSTICFVVSTKLHLKSVTMNVCFKIGVLKCSEFGKCYKENGNVIVWITLKTIIALESNSTLFNADNTTFKRKLE